ncbi:DNRLRE domain-containing protein [Ideonella paludis]|uniref:DNRLRE domain-containing protein n=1 Tax=Ideonella paludis TaxID=1233411 RepID=A0ABS5E287_9BURK|nr:DNRLRE domain-containing protein [Ideonella paludis]MBQ0937492.1 DNRLRE domain-containing protein [Ideonella paludis]
MKRRAHGFLLLPVLLLLSMVAGAAYLTLRESHLSLAGEARHADWHKARAAAEAGLHRVVHEAHVAACNGNYPVADKPITDTNFDGASYSAFASEKDGSPLDITSEGRFGTARVVLKRKKVVMHRATPQTLVLQAEPEGLDTSLKLGVNSPEPTAPTLSVQPGAHEALLAFGLQSIPAGSHISTALLSARITELQGSGSVNAHRIQSDWTEQATARSRDGTNAWVQSAGDAHPGIIVSAQTLGLGWMNWPLTELVDGWVKGRWPNQGVLLRGTKMQSLSLASRDYPTPALRPRLTVSFHPPCGWTLPQQQLTLVPAADATLSEASPTLNDGASNTLRALNSAKELRLVMLFDTSSIAANKTIKSATLRLTFEGLAGDTPTPRAVDLYARRNESAWEESVVTWTKRTASDNWFFAGAGVFTPLQPSTKTLPKDSKAGTVVEFDAKDWVNDWVANPNINYGVLIRVPNTEANTLVFGSRESLTAPPALTIEYE